SVADVQDAGIDLLQRAERPVRRRLDRGQIRRDRLSGLRLRRTRHPDLSCGDGRGHGPEKPSPILIDFVGHYSFPPALLLDWIHRPGARCLTSWISQPLPSGSMNDTKLMS